MLNLTPNRLNLSNSKPESTHKASIHATRLRPRPALAFRRVSCESNLAIRVQKLC